MRNRCLLWKILGAKFLMMWKKFLRHLSTILYSDNNINFGGDIDLPTNDLVHNFHSNGMLVATNLKIENSNRIWKIGSSSWDFSCKLESYIHHSERILHQAVGSGTTFWQICKVIKRKLVLLFQLSLIFMIFMHFRNIMGL